MGQGDSRKGHIRQRTCAHRPRCNKRLASLKTSIIPFVSLNTQYSKLKWRLKHPIRTTALRHQEIIKIEIHTCSICACALLSASPSVKNS